jgi:colanic acid/amylovoran biosynthesis glycosyltransferase
LTLADPVTTHEPRLRIAYIMSRFPKLSETFILNEVLAMLARDVEVKLFPLLRTSEAVVQPEARRLADGARHVPFLSAAVLGSQIYFLFAHPRRYVATLAAIVRGTWGSPNYLLKGLAIFPKCVHSARLMQKDGIQHVHCHFSSHPALAGFIVRRLTGIPFSFTAHGSDLHVDRHMLCQKVIEASFVAAVSTYNKRLIERECGGSLSKVRVVHSGIDSSQFVRNGQRMTPEPFRIVSVGRLEPVKGQQYLVEACRLLLSEELEFHCELIGDGPERARLTALVDALGLGERIHFAGPRTHDYVISALQSAHVLVCPSIVTADGRREGIPVVLMEALATETAVIASEISGIPELVENGRTGLLVTAGSAEEIASAIKRLAADPDLRTQLGAAGRAKVMQEFNISGTVDRLLELIQPRSLGATEHARN